MQIGIITQKMKSTLAKFKPKRLKKFNQNSINHYHFSTIKFENGHSSNQDSSIIAFPIFLEGVQIISIKSNSIFYSVDIPTIHGMVE